LRDETRGAADLPFGESHEVGTDPLQFRALLSGSVRSRGRREAATTLGGGLRAGAEKDDAAATGSEARRETDRDESAAVLGDRARGASP